MLVMNFVECVNCFVVCGVVIDGEEGVYVDEVEVEVVDVDGVARGDGEASFEFGGGCGVCVKGGLFYVVWCYGCDIGWVFWWWYCVVLNCVFDDEGYDEEGRFARRRLSVGERIWCFCVIFFECLCCGE